MSARSKRINISASLWFLIRLCSSLLTLLVLLAPSNIFSNLSEWYSFKYLLHDTVNLKYFLLLNLYTLIYFFVINLLIVFLIYSFPYFNLYNSYVCTSPANPIKLTILYSIVCSLIITLLSPAYFNPSFLFMVFFIWRKGFEKPYFSAFSPCHKKMS